MQKDKLLHNQLDDASVHEDGQGTHSDLFPSVDSVDMEMNGERLVTVPFKRSRAKARNDVLNKFIKQDTDEQVDKQLELAPAMCDLEHYQAHTQLIEMKPKCGVNILNVWTPPAEPSLLSGKDILDRNCQSVMLVEEVETSKSSLIHQSSEFSAEGGSSQSNSNKIAPLSRDMIHSTGDVQNDGGQVDTAPAKTTRPPGSRVVELPGNPKLKQPQDPKKYRVNDNYISTTKYSILSFLPLGLLYQFLRFSNIYFLVVTILQCIPTVSPLNPYTAVMPMLFVLSISMIREGYEDYQRYKSDQDQNSQPTEIYDKASKQFKAVASSELKVGDIVKIDDEAVFPCDILFLVSSSPEGDAFIKTSSLDGEKNLKKRIMPKDFDKKVQPGDLKRAAEQIQGLDGEVVLQEARKELDKFDGYMMQSGEQYSISDKQLLLKGASLQNTKWILGVCSYTGIETKIMLNSQKGRVKMSHLEKQINKLVIVIVSMQLCMCLLVTLLSVAWFNNETFDDLYILDSGSNTPSVLSTIQFFSYFLLLNTMLPISLAVSLEVIKLIQARFIEVDTQCFSVEREVTIEAKTASLVEELGQINYIFSDKTGTLTRNVMEFKYMVVGNEFYGDKKAFYDGANPAEEDEDQKLVRQMTNKEEGSMPDLNSEKNLGTWHCKNYDAVMSGQNDSDINLKVKSSNGNDSLTLKKQSDQITEFMKVLALAHGCVPESFVKDGKKEKFFNGPSPDEVALVQYAMTMGYDCIEAKDDVIVARLRTSASEADNDDIDLDDLEVGKRQNFAFGKPMDYKLLRRMDFNSDRKRMSVLLEDPNDGKIKLYIKGADSIIKDRLDRNQLDKRFEDEIEDFLNTASKQGLRTLLMGMRIIEQQEAEDFMNACQDAEKNLEKKDVLLDQIYSEIEKNVVLLGATAVEDRLQDEVPQTINQLQQAGIKIWMLTGDKLETAENIGESCKLLKKENMQRHRLSTQKDVAKFCTTDMIEKNKKRMNDGEMLGILVEAKALVMILENETFKANFLKISKTAEAVIACRVSPGQKADVVALIKEDDDEMITLAIGDGANDVSMIREAHIGIGLFGNEGMSAVNSSDFALGEFRMLWRLLLVHGRLYYFRNAEMVLYFFYKNFIMTLPQFLYAFFCGYSGQTIYEDFYISFFNLAFTIFPLMVKATFESDINYRTDGIQLKKLYPYLYYVGSKKTIYTFGLFICHMSYALLHTLIIFFLPLAFMHESQVLLPSGQNSDFWAFSLTSFTCVIAVVNVRINLWTRWWNWITVLFYILSIIIYIAYIWVSENIGFNDYLFVGTTNGSGVFWFTVFFITGLITVSDIGIEYIRITYFKNGSDYIRELVAKKLDQPDFDEKTGVTVSAADVTAFEAFMAPINAHYRQEELKREAELEEIRNKKAREAANTRDSESYKTANR